MSKKGIELQKVYITSLVTKGQKAYTKEWQVVITKITVTKTLRNIT